MAMMNNINGGNGGGIGVWPPFTVAQWQELELQALIFKYLKAGLPVPPDLLTPIRRSFLSPSAGLFQYPSSGYCSLYGNKFDPEPGRCRRTDGKKWRCAKNAYPNSKYCERHMNRTRNRSRKPVEPVPTSQSSSTLASGVANGSRNDSLNLPLNNTIGSREGPYFVSNALQSQIDPISYGINNKEYRCLQDLKPEPNERAFIPKISGSLRYPSINSHVDSDWGLMPSQVPLNFSSEKRSDIFLQNYSPQMQEFGSLTTDAAMLKQEHNYFLGRDFISPPSVNQEHQSVQPFFNEWPNIRDARSYVDDEKCNKNTFSATQLSMSIPMTSSEFFTQSNPSPNDA